MSERAGQAEGAERGERAGQVESAAIRELRASPSEGAENRERAAIQEGADERERPDAPKYLQGFPHIEAPSHGLWEAQQGGWEGYLPHEAWRALAEGSTKETKLHADSADHPAFAATYVPNYAATPEKPSEEYVRHRQGKGRR